MLRTPEPDLMSDDAQARAYAQADFEQPHAMFVHLLCDRFPGLGGDFRALDLGCGAADVTIRVARAFPRCVIDAVDGAEAMLRYARDAVASSGLQQRVRLKGAYLPDLTLEGGYDVILANSLLHHLKDPLDLWRTIKHYARRDTKVFVMDLLRPDGRDEAAALVHEHAGNEPEILRRDFFNSLCAAYRPDEVREQLRDVGLADDLAVEPVSDRHLIVNGTLNVQRSAAAKSF